jgi:Phosphotransferase enzyme family
MYAEIVDALIALELMDASTIVGNGISFIDASRRNHNLLLEFSRGGGYFIKIGTDAERRLTLAHEALMYKLLRSLLSGACTSSLPKVYAFDPERSMLVLEMLNSKTAGTIYGLRSQSAPRIIGMLGKALGGIHRELGINRAIPESAWSFRPVPFELKRPSNTFLETCSGANLEFLKILQQSERLCSSLKELESHWHRTVESSPQIIHGDVRLDNCCLPASRKSIRIVDWELAGRGDPDWDVGAVLADLLSGWLMSIPPSATPDSVQYAHLSKIPLELVRSAAQSFWSAYIRARVWTPSASLEALQTCTRYAAARLIQLAFEHLQGSSVVTSYAIGHLQVSDNLLDRPVGGAALLLGLVA